jgi:predicted membrane chloride channel (bestrophin family)
LDIDKIKDRIKTTAYYNYQHVKKMRQKIDLWYADWDNEKRLQEHLCKYCFYVNNNRIAGQAITTTNCDSCNIEIVFPSTDTDRFCDGCAIELNACRHCGGEID